MILWKVEYLIWDQLLRKNKMSWGWNKLNKAQINRIYDRFPPEARDISREDFIKEVRGLSDPVKMEQDLANIQLLKASERTNRERIDRSLRRK